MEWKPIKIYCLVEPMLNMGPHSGTVNEWLHDLGVSEKVIDEVDGLANDLTRSESSEADTLVALAAKRCYLSFEPGLNPNVTQVRKDWHEYLNNILAQHHGSVLEHASFTYAIEGLSRVATAELNRHRAGTAISEGSQRYIRYDSIAMTETPLMTANVEEAIAIRQFLTRVAQFVEQEYAAMVEALDLESQSFSVKKVLTSALRRALPQGIATGGVWTFNLRALRHIIALRSSPHAEEEIAHLASLLAKDILHRAPGVFQDFEQNTAGYWVPKFTKV